MLELGFKRTRLVWQGVLTPGGGNLHLAAIHFHCHAPTCLSMKMMRNDTKEVICEERPIYGGTGKIDLAKFDERGYILQPPCLWGDAGEYQCCSKARICMLSLGFCCSYSWMQSPIRCGRAGHGA